MDLHSVTAGFLLALILAAALLLGFGLGMQAAGAAEAGGGRRRAAQAGVASVYGPGERGQRGTVTASGVPLQAGALTAAHKTLPLGSRARVTNTRTGRSVTVRITDRGPFMRGRVIDLRRGHVVYFAFEGGHGYPKRTEALRLHHDLDADDPPPLHIVTEPTNLIREHRLLVHEIARQLPEGAAPVMVVLDTLNRSFVGSESKDEDMASYIRAAEVIRNQWDCIVVIVHHCGHDTSRPRGHSGLTAAVDAQIAITREEGSDIIVATVEFMRDGPEGQEVVGVARKIEVGEDKGGKVLTSLVIEPHDQKDAANRPKPWPRSLKVFREAVIEATLVCGVDFHIKDGPTVKAVDLERVRKVFYQMHIVESDGSAEQRQDSKKKAFARAVRPAQRVNLIGAWTAEEDQLIWLVRS